jgi:hypothetical protein
LRQFGLLPFQTDASEVENRSMGTSLAEYFFNSLLVLLSQKVATNDEENHLFGKIHFSDGSAENGSAKIE